MAANSQQRLERKPRKSSRRVELPILTEEEIFGASSMQSPSGYNQIAFLVNRPPAALYPTPERGVGTESLSTPKISPRTSVDNDSKSTPHIQAASESCAENSAKSGIIETLSTGDTESQTVIDNVPRKPFAFERKKSNDLESLPPVDDDSKSTPPVAYERKYLFKPQPLRQAQDGHSNGEQSLFEKLWELAPAIVGELKFRRITIGYGDLARVLKVDKKQVRRWLTGLQSKLAIEIEAEGGVTAKTTYKVYSWQSVIQRRKAAGYVAFVRNRGGVVLLTSHQPESLSPVDNDSMSTPVVVNSASTEDTVPTPPMGTVSTGGVDNIQETGVDNKSPLYKQVTLYKSSSSERAEAIAELRKFTPDVDDDYADLLIRRCREICPTATLSEIGYYIGLKAQYRGIQRSVTGFLLEAVPKCLQGESFRQYRESERLRLRAERQQWLEMKERAERTLEHPELHDSWEVDNAASTVQWLRAEQPWLFNDLP